MPSAGDLVRRVGASSSGSSNPFVDHYGVVSADGRHVIHKMDNGQVYKHELRSSEWRYAGRGGGRAAAERAESHVGSSYYDLLTENCEHFARRMVGDGDRSLQLAGAGTGAAIGGTLGTALGCAALGPAGIAVGAGLAVASALFGARVNGT
eukprot:6459423-Amphidinium_carterae.1